MTEIRIEVDDTRIQAALNRLLRVSQDLSPVMVEIAGHLEAGVKSRFRSQTGPDGQKWPALSETTKKRRRKTGHTPITILQQSGLLARSIQSHSDKMSAVAGTNVWYAATHQFGAAKGEFGSFSVIARMIRGKYTRLKSNPTVQVPWGKIPARPFLGLSEDDTRNILDTINDFIEQQWR